MIKSLYGLRQSGRNWNNLLCGYLCDIGFAQSNVDLCIYTRSKNDNLTTILVQVDDLIILCDSQELVEEIKTNLFSKFDMKNLRELSLFLGISFKITEDFITMDQSHYLEVVLKQFNLFECKGWSTTCEINLASHEVNNINPDETDTTKYSQMVGSIILRNDMYKNQFIFYCFEVITEFIKSNTTWFIIAQTSFPILSRKQLFVSIS